ncbi:SulP family inorganic anion transporter [Gammaproteobacteria bacterium]|nr:SulP family inorganic anion transporter [Gammaproteobacteria bacterium]
MLPLAQHLKNYNRQTLAQDTTAGLVVGMVTIPQAIAYAFLAGVPAEAGLYACLLPMILYALLGSSPHLVVGPVAIAALMIVSTVSEYAPKFSSEYLMITQLVCIEVSLIFVAMRILRLGSLTSLISQPVMTGFVNGAVFLIIASQIPIVIGIDSPSTLSGTGNFFHLIAKIDEFELPSIIMGLGALAFLMSFRWTIKTVSKPDSDLSSSHKHSLLIGLGPIILVIASIVFVYSFDNNFALETVGKVPDGLPIFIIPNLDAHVWLGILPGSFIIALVTYIESYSIATAIASKEQKTINAHQELLALSAANMGAGFTGAYPVAGSFSRSSVNYFSGAKTPISSVICSLVIIVSLLFLTEIFALLPLTVLAAIVILSVIGLLDFSALYQNWQTQKLDKVSELMTFLGVFIIGVEPGLILGILSSVLFVLMQSSRPQITEVGRIPGTDFFRSNKRYEVEPSPDLIFVRIDENLFFGNATNIETNLFRLSSQPNSPTHLVIVCSAINRIDSTGLQMLSRLNSRLKEIGNSLHLSDLKGTLLENMDKAELNTRISGEIFDTASEAVSKLNRLSTKNNVSN